MVAVLLSHKEPQPFKPHQYEYEKYQQGEDHAASLYESRVD